MSAADVRRELMAIAVEAPPNPFSYPRTYLVRAVDGNGRFDLDPPPDAPDLPRLAKVEQWVMGGELSFPAAGTPVLVLFRDARQERAVVVGIAPGAVGAPALSTADTAGRYALDPGVPGGMTPIPPALYYQAPGASTLTPVQMITPPGSTAGGTVPSLPGITPATTIALGPGSSKIKVTP